MFTPKDADFEERVRASFARQRVMSTVGAQPTSVSPGEVIIEIPFREDLTQQDGYLYAAIVTAIADSACGYAAHTLLPAGAGILTVEYKVNFRPGCGPHVCCVRSRDQARSHTHGYRR